MMDMIDLLFVLFNTSCIDITNNDPYGTVNSPFCEPCTFVSMKESRENCELFFFFGEVWRLLRGRENGLCSNPQKIQSERVEVVVGGWICQRRRVEGDVWKRKSESLFTGV